MAFPLSMKGRGTLMLPYQQLGCTAVVTAASRIPNRQWESLYDYEKKTTKKHLKKYNHEVLMNCLTKK